MMEKIARLVVMTLGLTIGVCQAGAEMPQRYSASSLYNLGNSYALAGKPGMAVLNYERASLLAPNDADIEANLHEVLLASKLPIEPRSTLVRVFTFENAAVMFWLGVAGVLVVGVTLILARLSGRRRVVRTIATLMGVGLIALPVGNVLVLWPILHAGVVIQDASTVRVSPVPMGDALFVLPQAEIVKIAAEYDDYYLIRTRSGREGWLPKTHVVAILPAAKPTAKPVG